MGSYQTVSDLLQTRFTPGEAGSAGRSASAKAMTLHDALKVSLGMVPDWSVLAYWRPVELERDIARFYDQLSTIVGVRSDVWAIESARTEAEVLAALRDAERAFPGYSVATSPVEARPGMGQLIGTGKPRAAVASSVSLIAAGSSSSFASTLSQYLAQGINDLDLVAALDADAYPVRTVDADWSVAEQFAKVAGPWFEGSTSWLVSSFCRAVFEDWSGRSDADLLERLADVARETAERKRGGRQAREGAA